MAEDGILLLSTKVDLSGANQLAAGVTSAMGEVRSSTATATASMVEFKSGTTGATAAAMSLGSAGASVTPLTESMVGLTAAVQGLISKIDQLPAHSVVATKEAEAGFDALQEHIIRTAEAARLSATGIGSAFGGLSALLGGGILVGFLARFLDEAKEATLEIGHFAERTGLAVETVAGLQIEAQRLGLGLETIQTGLIRVERAQALALEGHKQQAQAFHDIGLSYKELETLSPEELLNRVSGAIQQQTDQATKMNAVIALLGRGGAGLIPIFDEYGSTLVDGAHKLGDYSGVTEAAVQESLRWQKVQTDVGVELRKLAIEVLPLVTDAIKFFTIGIVEAQSAYGEFIIKAAEYSSDMAAVVNPTTSFTEKLQTMRDNASLAALQMDDLNRKTAEFVNGSLADASGKAGKFLPDISSDVDKWLGQLKGKRSGKGLEDDERDTGAEDDAKEQAKLDHLKEFAEARYRLKSDEARREYELGNISSQEETQRLEAAEQERDRIIVSGLEAQKKALTGSLGDYAPADKLEQINGQISAILLKGKDDREKIEAEGGKQTIKELIESQNEHIALIKAETASTLQEKAEQAAGILAIERQTKDALASLDSTRDQRHAQDDKVLAAVHELNSAIQAENRAAAQAELYELEEQTKSRLKILSDEATREEATVAEQTRRRQAEQAETYKTQTSQPFVAPVSKIAEAQSNADALIAIARSSAEQQQEIISATVNKEAQALLGLMPAFSTAYMAGDISAEAYGKKVEAVMTQITALAQTAATKQTQIASQESTQENKIQEQLLQTYLQVKQQEEAAISGFVTSATGDLNNFAVTIATTVGEVNGKISETRYIQEQFGRMFIEIERQFYQMILKMIEDTTAFKAVESSIKGVFDSAFKAIGLIKVPPPQPAGIPGLAGGVPLQGGQIPGAATGTAQQTAANGALTEFTSALHLAASAVTQSHAATIADTTATQGSATATATDTAAKHGSTAATTLATGATHDRYDCDHCLRRRNPYRDGSKDRGDREYGGKHGCGEQ